MTGIDLPSTLNVEDVNTVRSTLEEIKALAANSESEDLTKIEQKAESALLILGPRRPRQWM